MKKSFLIFIVVSLFVFAGCGGDSKKAENNGSDETVTDEDGGTADAEPSDTEPADTESADTGQDDGGQTGDSGEEGGDTVSDNGDSADDADSSDPADSGDDTDSGEPADDTDSGSSASDDDGGSDPVSDDDADSASEPDAVEKCDNAGGTWNASENKCTRTLPCDPKPENAFWNGSNSYTQEFAGGSWSAKPLTEYNEKSEGECRFKCAAASVLKGDTCVSILDNPCPAASYFPCVDNETNFVWSSKAKNIVYAKVLSYCEDLTESGFTDWHTPTINQLRTLVTKCESTEPEGLCGVTDSCTQNSCNKDCTLCNDTSVKHSKLGDDCGLVSSSENEGVYYYIDFSTGQLRPMSSSFTDIRCTRCGNGYFWDGTGCAKLSECGKETTVFPCYDSGSRLTWSSMSPSTERWAKMNEGEITAYPAADYCKSLNTSNFGGYDDWRLPTIDELRTLIVGCPTSVYGAGSSCKVSDPDHLSSAVDWSEECYCERDETEGYCKLGGTKTFWSSSLDSNAGLTEPYAWLVLFINGHVHSNKVKESNYVRCVR